MVNTAVAISALLLLHHTSPLFPYTTLFRSVRRRRHDRGDERGGGRDVGHFLAPLHWPRHVLDAGPSRDLRSEEHTSELQSHSDLVCRLLLEKKKTVPPGREAGRSGTAAVKAVGGRDKE